MKRVLPFVFTLLTSALLAQETNIVSGNAMVMLYDHESIDQLITDLRVVEGKNTSIEKIEAISSHMNMWLVGFDDRAIRNQDMLDAILLSPLVIEAQYNHTGIELRATPNDPEFSKQWGMHNTGQTGGTNDFDIDAEEAWDISTGGLSADGDEIVAVVDDVPPYLTHPDLNFWKNANETPNNGVDDDGNGYIDDYEGWDPKNNDGTLTPRSSSWHGTHVSGIVGAIGNNGVGVTGVNWDVKILPIDGNSTTESTVLKGYGYMLAVRKQYNATNGAKGAFIVSSNSSFGVDFGSASNYPLWCAFYDSLGEAGILNMAATSNSTYNVETGGDIPSNCTSDYLIGVAETNDDGVHFGGYGTTSLDLSAPGEQVYSTYSSTGYGNSSGTSMACPHVTGAVSLMYAAACQGLIWDYKANPGGIAKIMRGYLLDNVTPVAGLSSRTVTGGFLNVHKALQAVETYDCFSSVGEIESVGNITLYPNPAKEQLTIYLDKNDFEKLQLNMYDVLGNLVRQEVINAQQEKYLLPTRDLKAGYYFIRLSNSEGQMFTSSFIRTKAFPKF